MHVDEQHSGDPDPVATQAARPLRRAGPRDAHPAVRRQWIAAAWIGGGLALFALFLRISLSSPVNSDGANNALQAWDMLHGHLLLHGWVSGDASVYTFELPLLAITESLFGLTTITCHIASALTYLTVAAFSVALAVTNSRGAAAAARCGVVIAVLAGPLLTTGQGVAILLQKPDHIGTSAFLLGSFLLIDRAPGWRFTPPLLLVILCAGQLGDATVLYVAVPTVVLVCAYRALAARKIRTVDTVIALAAVASVPLAILARQVMVHFGAFAMVPPRTRISSPGQWAHNALLTLHFARTLFGAIVIGPGTGSGVAAAAFGWACLLAAAFGFVKVIWTWRTASRAEQLVCAAIVINLAIFIVSVLPTTTDQREIAAVLPCGAVLAARACVPARIVGSTRARVAVLAATLAAVLPLAVAAAQPPATSPAVTLAAWLKAHRLTYGLAGYWEASVVTLDSGNRVQVRAIVHVRAINPKNNHFTPYYWETKPGWYDASRYRATFVISESSDGVRVADAEHSFGRPVAIYHVAGCRILVYRTNLLAQLRPAPLPNG
jgi:hypothetical protein